jgi:type I restriction enzyme S subunit
VSAWKRVALGDFATSVDYGVTAAANLQPVGPKFLRITDIQDGAVNWDTVPWCECDARSAEASRLQAGDIVFARTGATTGKSFLIRECPLDAVFASYLIRVRVGDKADPRYVSHFFQTSDYWAQITKGARGVAQPGVNATTLKAIQVPLPPVAEQARIAEVLDRAGALRAKRRATLAQVDILAESLFYDLFGDPAMNARDEWPRVELGSVTEMVTGYPFPSEEYVTSGERVRLCRGTNVLPGRLDWSDLACWPTAKIDEVSELPLSAGDVVLAMDRPWISEGFKIARVRKEDCPALLVQRVARLRGKNGVLNEFLFYLLNQPGFTRHCRPTETTIPHISPTDIRSFKFYLPPGDLQRKFALQLARVEELKATLRASLAKKDALFLTLQNRAFRGAL